MVQETGPVPIPSPAALDRAGEQAITQRWPSVSRMTNAYLPLYMACALLLAATVLILLGEPYAYGAGAPVGGAFGLNIAYLITAKRNRPG